ncbi:unnamed protein product [Knipowitschia caucasica]|uniref:EF-hand domain-containing protein n=1 Tax=Knipowitschia caucasica TaxID=637954 RepID=A0AAV2MLV2_KNICA
MAALRRTLTSLAHGAKTTAGFGTSAPGKQSQSTATKAAKAVAALGTCVTAAGYCYYYYNRRPEGGRPVLAHTDSGLLPSVAAVDQPGSPRLVVGEVYKSSYENRFRLFSSIEHDGQLFMTPLNFIESVTLNQPKSRKGWRSLTKKELDKILSDTPPIWKGSSNLFRNLRERGVISYTEYLFLICILTKPHAGFKIAFNMFDADGNEMVDKREFLVLEEIFRKKKEKKEVIEGGGKVDEQTLQLYGHRKPLQPASVDDKAETTLLVHFFGKKGKAELKFEDFYKFMDDLQTEMLEVEFLSFSKGMPTISEEDFARILLRYTNVDDVSAYLDNVRSNMPDEKGISFEEFRSFFQFLNNLEDFTIAMQMYNFANRSIGQEEFTRAVYVATGITLTHHLVNTVFKIFDEDHDGKLSYKEFLGVMKDRLQRGEGRFRAEEKFVSFKTCLKKELSHK